MLIKHSDLDRAEVFPSLGFVQSRDFIGPGSPEVEWVHDSRLPLIYHWELFRVPFYRVPLAEVWSRSGIHLFSWAPVGLLSPADNLIHICGSLFDEGSHDRLRWACDAWFIIQRHPDLDWAVLLDHASRGHMALPLFITVGYLAQQLNAPIPVDVLNRLGVAASKSDSIGTELALFGALRNARGGLMKTLHSCGDWSTWLLVVKWAFFPSSGYLRWVHEIRSSWLVPFYYPYRPVKFIVRQIFFFCRRHVRLHSRQPGTDPNHTVHSPLLRRPNRLTISPRSNRRSQRCHATGFCPDIPLG